MAMTSGGPLPRSHDGRSRAITADSASPMSGMANCRFCQKSNVIARTFRKCGWFQ
jgi:hypothetical protein